MLATGREIRPILVLPDSQGEPCVSNFPDVSSAHVACLLDAGEGEDQAWMDPMPGPASAEVAKAYVAAVEGSHQGRILDPHEFAK